MEKLSNLGWLFWGRNIKKKPVAEAALGETDYESKEC